MISAIKTMTEQIQAAMRGFNEIILGGVPIWLKQNATAFLSFMCSVAAIDALAGYRYRTDNGGERFKDFIREYFPCEYAPHADSLYLLRCRILHNFSLAYFTLAHATPSAHLVKSSIEDTVLSDDVFFSDLAKAAAKFFDEEQTDPSRQDVMNERLLKVNKGGAIYYE